MHLTRSTISTVLKASPGDLTFTQDMLLNIPLIADWQIITLNREALVNKALLKNNQRLINYDYYVRQHVLKYDNTIKDKLAVKTSGPFEIVPVHVNSTVTIQLQAGVTEHYTIPYRDPLV